MDLAAFAARALNRADDFLQEAADTDNAKTAADWTLAAKNCVGAAQHAIRALGDEERLPPRIRSAA